MMRNVYTTLTCLALAASASLPMTLEAKESSLLSLGKALLSNGHSQSSSASAEANGDNPSHKAPVALTPMLKGGVSEFKIRGIYPGSPASEACDLAASYFPEETGLKEMLGLSPYSQDWAFRDLYFMPLTKFGDEARCKGNFEGYDSSAGGIMAWSDYLEVHVRDQKVFYVKNAQVHVLNGGMKECTYKRNEILNDLKKTHGKPTSVEQQNELPTTNLVGLTWDFSVTKDAEIGSDELETYYIYIQCEPNNSDESLIQMNIQSVLHSGIAIKSAKAAHKASTSKTITPSI